MASLDKLAIRGIRSFDDKGINIIQFYNPLTVIVGYNGSGKTTIIECLKYATTGDLPPNTKGGAFVHDPTMAATNEVKAQVRLRFYNTNHVRINCVRNLQVSKKKTTGLTMKTLESLLQVDDENKKNKRTVLSTKCADLDTEIPRLLGVSRAILDNVIFCHQEESNWPLSEPATLKKKFDDIFEATRYTKALDNIKSLRKEQAVELKVQRAELEGLKTDKERADAIKDKKRRLESSLAEKEAHLDDLNETIAALTKSNRDFYNRAVQFRETVARAEAMEEKIKLFSENMEELRATMTPIDEPEAELQKRKERFGEHLDQQRRRKAELIRKIEDKKDEATRLEALRGRKIGEKGGLENDRKHHHQAVEAREAEIRSMSCELGIKGFDTGGLSDAQIAEFEARVGESARRVAGELQALRSDGAKKDAEMTAQWQELRSDLRAKQAEHERAGDAMRKLRERIKRAQDDLDGAAVTAADVDAASKDWEDAKAKAAALKAEAARADVDGRTREKNREIRDLDQAREDLTVELNGLNRHADFRARLDVKKTERAAKEQEVQSLLQCHGAAVQRHTGREPVAARLESDMNAVVAAKEGELSGLERSDAAAAKELQRIESALSFARATLRDLTARAAAIEQEIGAALADGGHADLPAAVRECEAEIKYLVESISGAEYAADFFARVKTAAQTKHSCIACNRGISDAELPGISTWIEAQIRRTAPAELEERGRDLQDWKAQLAVYQALVPKQAALDALRQTELPAEQRKVAREEERLAAATSAAERASAAVEALRAELREMASLKKAAADVSRLLREAAALARDVEGLEGDLLSTGTMRTGGDVQREIDAHTDSLKRAKRELLDLQSQREHQQAKQQQCERDVHQAELRVAATRQEHAAREALVVRAQELKAELADAKQAAQTLDEDIAQAGPPIRRAKDALDALKAEQATREQALNNETTRLSGLVRRLRELNEQAARYVAQRGGEKLRECEDAIAELAAQITAVQKGTAAVELEAARIEKDLNESKATERSIHDNLRFRHLHAEVQRIQAEHAALSLDEASEASKTWDAKYNSSKKRENELNGEAAHLGGEISSLRAQIAGREQELREDYKHVEKRYTAKLIAFKTGEMANRDLELYGKALDNAIMRYHAIKMEEINEQIRYLWGRTYQGTDIDTISIRSDNEGNKAGRSYYYRVCMVKDTVEMDMRGRCSAGQKVLASIIIRLALADSFGENCGILALDEPTTNLDKENIVALAKSLNDIIRERRNQSNFQLIVITHDEEFLTMLGQSDSLEYYWRCSRNAQQKSIIERESIQ